MAISIPIIAEWKGGDAIRKARQEFSQLEGAGAKAGFAIKKAAIPAAAALAGVGAALFDATKGAIEDAAAQDLLAKQIRRSTKATDAQIAANEDWISTQGQLLGVTDDKLRPALAGLVRVTGDITKAQKAATLAMDVAAAKNVDLETVTKALEKAYGGNLTALGKIAPELRGMIKDGASLDQVMAKLNGTFGGAAAEAANTVQGRFQRLKVSFDETKESIGASLIPVVEAALPILQKFGDWAAKNPETFKMIALAIGAVAISIMAVNAAMALNPFSAIAAGIALLVVGLGVAYKKFEGFRNVVNTVANFVLGYFETIINGWIMVINGIIRGYNLIPGLPDIKTLSHVTLPRIRSGGPDTEGLSASRITALADGGIVRPTPGGTLALIAEAGEPEAVIPLSKMGKMGGDTNVQINVHGGDPQQVVNALRRYMQVNGSVPIKVAY